MGQDMTEERIQNALQLVLETENKRKQELQLDNDGFEIELMVHPGYKSISGNKL